MNEKDNKFKNLQKILERRTDAEQSLLTALRLEPHQGEVLSALVIFYIQGEAWELADHYVRELQRLHPDAPELRELLQTIATERDS